MQQGAKFAKISIVYEKPCPDGHGSVKIRKTYDEEVLMGPSGLIPVSKVNL